MRLSPADDLIIRVERPLDIDSDAQLVASVLSKKFAAGATHVVLDMPVGPTAKVRTAAAARSLRSLLMAVGDALGLSLRVIESDGSQPVGRGIGPALEARDVLAVLQREPTAAADLCAKAITLAGDVLELVGGLPPGLGADAATAILDDGRAWRKFVAICEAQGGLRQPPVAPLTHDVQAIRTGQVVAIDNRRLARVAKLSGAPKAPAAGLALHAPLRRVVSRGESLFTLHAETPGELAYARAYADANPDIVALAEAT